MQHVLILDDDAGFRNVARMVFEDHGFEVSEASCPEEAFVMLLAGQQADLIFCDLHMPFTNTERQEEFCFSHEVGYKTAKELAWALPNSKVIVVSALAPSDIERLNKSLNPIQAFSKPTSPRDLLQLVDNISIIQ